MRTTEIRPETAPKTKTPTWSSELAVMWGTTFVCAVLCGVTWFVV